MSDSMSDSIPETYHAANPLHNAPFQIIYRAFIYDKRLTPSEKIVFQLLLTRCCGKDATWITAGTLAKDMCCSTRSIKDYLKKLEKYGFIELKKRQRKSAIKIVQRWDDIYDVTTLHAPLPTYIKTTENPESANSALPENQENVEVQNLHSENPRSEDSALPESSKGKICTLSNKRLRIKDQETQSKDKETGRARPGLQPLLDKCTQIRPGRAEEETTEDSTRVDKPKTVMEDDVDGGGGFSAGHQPENNLQACTKAPTNEHPTQSVMRHWDDIAEEHHDDYVRPRGHSLKIKNHAKLMLKEYDIKDILKMFKMAILDWNAIMEKWPTVAKTRIPTFFAVFTLREQLISLARSGKGVKTRANRVSAFGTSERKGKPPRRGWGGENGA